MRIEVDSKILVSAIRSAMRIAPPLTGTLIFHSDGTKLEIKSASDLARVKALVPAPVDGEALFAVSCESLQAALKATGTVELVYDKSMLNIKSGRTLTKLSTVDAIVQDADEVRGEEEAQVWKIAGEQSSWLKTAVSAVALKPSNSVATFMPVSIKLTKKGAFVSCYDDNHMTFVTDDSIVGDLNLTLPLETITTILDVFNMASYSLKVGKSTIKVRNKIIQAEISLLSSDSDELVGVDEVQSKAIEALSTKGSNIELSKKDLVDFLDVARSVSSKERSEIVLAVEESKLKLSVTTTNGSSKTQIKAKTKSNAKVKLDFEFFDEAVRKAVDNLSIKIVEDAFILVMGKSANSVLALNQE